MNKPHELAPPRSTASVFLRMLISFALMGLISMGILLATIFMIPWRLRRIRLGNLYGKLVGSTIFRLAGIRPVITDSTGLPGGPMEGKQRIDTMGPGLVVCNHTSTIDMWIGMWLNPYGGCGVAKKEILKIPFFGVIYWLTGHLLLDRSNLQKSIKSMAEIGEFVRAHNLGIWMWPEGSRSRDGRLKPFKKGFVHMAIATGLPVIPIISHNADLMWPGGSFKVRPGPLDMEVLPPIDTSEWRVETAAEHAKEVRTVIRAALSARQQGDP